jgi:hypothetical protein|tara:strand:+ start:4083 stop:4223 length:141 start_codon:yes stop_codon:yes gene_type:complete
VVFDVPVALVSIVLNVVLNFVVVNLEVPVALVSIVDKVVLKVVLVM